ncbi:hypothetical protein EHI_126760 [Entamoeba histolytica HM-1:IMSS]|uniref:Uncharacterized protein n=1 Tax=Entamoeba histolytica (strain ATCC 30459 / HM-1:IMSS / ABRM) TaxID=294381 RepID=B1N5Z5_ENTH1|nr:hypothetical protein EHI_126760 [Entamoeba histolytica HM-1:IMSS]EDS88613.1 hypothetical protein EHI_126760 [Entamoeba histolytica HM-1:IMSS]|eukprot:XP_001914611.1 hypothetical protein EHI_126760 [Entamoeba histolytica HM-1:IMSS]
MSNLKQLDQYKNEISTFLEKFDDINVFIQNATKPFDEKSPLFDCVFDDNDTDKMTIEEISQRNLKYDETINNKIISLESYFDKVQEAIVKRKYVFSFIEEQTTRLNEVLLKFQETSKSVEKDFQMLSEENDTAIYEIVKAKKKSKELKIQLLELQKAKHEEEFKAFANSWEEKLENNAVVQNEKMIKNKKEDETNNRITAYSNGVNLNKKVELFKEIEKHSKTTFNRVFNLYNTYNGNCTIINNKNGLKPSLFLFSNANNQYFGAFVTNGYKQCAKSFLFKIKDENVFSMTLKMD